MQQIFRFYTRGEDDSFGSFYRSVAFRTDCGHGFCVQCEKADLIAFTLDIVYRKFSNFSPFSTFCHVISLTGHGL